MKIKDLHTYNEYSINETSLIGINKNAVAGITSTLDSIEPYELAYEYGAFFIFEDLNPRNQLKKEHLKMSDNGDTIIIEHMANWPIFVGIDVEKWKKLKLPMNIWISGKNGTVKTNIIFKGDTIKDFNIISKAAANTYIFVLGSQNVMNCSFDGSIEISTVLDEERLHNWKINIYKNPGTLNYEVTPLLQAFLEVKGLSGSDIEVFKHPKTGKSVFDILYNNSNKFNIYNIGFVVIPIVYPEGLKSMEKRAIENKNKEEYKRLISTRPGLDFFRKLDFYFPSQIK